MHARTQACRPAVVPTLHRRLSEAVPAAREPSPAARLAVSLIPRLLPSQAVCLLSLLLKVPHLLLQRVSWWVHMNRAATREHCRYPESDVHELLLGHRNLRGSVFARHMLLTVGHAFRGVAFHVCTTHRDGPERGVPARPDPDPGCTVYRSHRTRDRHVASPLHRERPPRRREKS